MSEDRRAALQAELARRSAAPSPRGEVNPNLQVPIARPEVGDAPRAPEGPSTSVLEEAQRRGTDRPAWEPLQQPSGTAREGAAPSRGALAELGTGLKRVGNQPVGQAVGEGLGRGAGEAGKDAGALVGDFFKSLLPTQEGAKAGGRVVGKLGDIGMFASGGGTGPVQTPAQVEGMRPGLNTQPQLRRPLPPPTVGVPRGPGVEAGPGPGQIPGSPPGTMRTPLPGELPAPGVAGQSAKAQPAAKPMIPEDAHLGSPSPFASAIAGNTDAAIARRFRRDIGAGQPGVRSDRGMQVQDQQITTAVDSIIEGKGDLQFRDSSDPTGQAMLPAGRLPRTVSEFSQAIDQLKGQVFQLYDGMATRLSGQGVRVQLDPVISRLQNFLSAPQVRDIEPGTARAATELIERFQKAGSYSPKEAQNVVSSLNASLEREIKKPTNAVSHNAMHGEVLESLRDTLNQTMNEAFKDPRYEALRNRYGALTSVEANVANAVRKQIGQPGLAEKLTNLGTWAAAAGSVGHAVLTRQPHVVGTMAATQVGKMLYNFMHSPNHAVSTIFRAREADIAPRPFSMTERASAALGARLGETRQEQFDRSFYPYRDPHVSASGP